jgi:hypothetical protein
MFDSKIIKNISLNGLIKKINCYFLNLWNMVLNGFKLANKWKIGNIFSLIRSENCLKNRFYGAMRKIIRKINRTVK